MIKRTLIPTLLFSSGIATAAPPPDEEAPAELIELRGELVDAGEQTALQTIARFRPLCDAEGYPLVGNILPKDGADAPPMAPPPEMYQPSAFCEDVRSGQRDA
jgi:hypothetical protein